MTLHVTRTFTDGDSIAWTTESGTTEQNMRRRLKAAGRSYRSGDGWIEIDYPAEVGGVAFTERLEWKAAS